MIADICDTHWNAPKCFPTPLQGCLATDFETLSEAEAFLKSPPQAILQNLQRDGTSGR
jgi:hypothetical protein